MVNGRRGFSSRVFLVAGALALFSMVSVSWAGAVAGDRSFAATVKANAQFYFGVMLAGGYGVPQDPGKGAIWVREAAEQGVAQAQYYLAVMYLRGHGVPQDSTASIAWFRKAAEQGVARAQARLGEVYASGIGVGRDLQAAFGWYLKAAEQGNLAATHNIGVMYLTVTPVDKVRGYQWIGRAVRLAEEEIKWDHTEGIRTEYRSFRRQFREVESVLMTPDEIRQAQALEKEWQTAHGG